MYRIETARILAIIGTLAAFFVVPSRAEDFSQPMQPREPVYVWQGNRIDDNRGMQAQEASGLPQAVQADGIRYITGGIGDEERDALENVKNDYNLHITSTDNAGEFNGDTHISIFNRRGEELLSANAGPLFYADLPAGIYTVEALSNGRPERRKVAVGEKKPSSLYFRW